MMLETMLLSHISFILGLAIDYISSQCLVLAAALVASTRSLGRDLQNTRNMPKQVKISATEVAANEVTKPQVIKTTIAGGRRYDATTGNGDTLEGVIILFREGIPAVIDGERKTVNKKWFGINTVIDALIMSEDDAIAAKAAEAMEGNFMALRGVDANISIFEDEDGELHYKLEF